MPQQMHHPHWLNVSNPPVPSCCAVIFVPISVTAPSAAIYPCIPSNAQVNHNVNCNANQFQQRTNVYYTYHHPPPPPPANINLTHHQHAHQLLTQQLICVTNQLQSCHGNLQHNLPHFPHTVNVHLQQVDPNQQALRKPHNTPLAAPSTDIEAPCTATNCANLREEMELRDPSEPLAVISEEEESEPECVDSVKDTDDECRASDHSITPPSSPSFSPVPSSVVSLPKLKRTLFRPRYPARAQLNIFIPENLTDELFANCQETLRFHFFPTVQALYYYVNMTTAFQINDRQIYVFELNASKVAFVNCDLHDSAGQVLYGVITENESQRRRDGKWEWQMKECLTKTEISARFGRFGLQCEDLPVSSRSFPQFQAQLQSKHAASLGACLEVIEATDWSNVERIRNRTKKQAKRGDHDEGVVVKLEEEAFKRVVEEVWTKSTAFPIVVNESKSKLRHRKQSVARRAQPDGHWVEWMKLIPVAVDADAADTEQQLFVGVSCRFDAESKRWQVSSLCLDKGDILNKHRLCGVAAYQPQQFETKIKDIQWVQ
eukprot:CAMPEP_0197072634 /NCGR_PEP_ID=MMETSP1384-20130603/210196_1 /TAXON_ID=29189 /ORGANISM="Ammonia sp." /LENGTH=544 /DNA_ID=CAMNT_0042511455 /DNA_START=111 /DNA_END=1745 /DNA_ORIENTATION=+